ncbi:glutathione S-transferase family protein [Aminobacter sp. MET-1]|uniref:glutathione S-transferase family protein n=1 Tax=Aminobacter sp. MET-1 TaxID=2951085 RepID=UPI00226A1740|nr:glutathione S-transferase family protein [Aminobacter sp. MET-1]MCX8569446.1 glutathione S-transferase family protein [Aminobacter sp. MET-1]
MTILFYDLVGSDAARPFSPHCWKVAMALEHKGLDYRAVLKRLVEVPEIEGGVSKTIPVIRDGDKVIPDSFAIALYLEEAYPEQPSLFEGPGGMAHARFIERWSQLTLHPYISVAALTALHAMQDDENAAYFRKSREARFGRPLEEVTASRDASLSGFRASLEPLRSMLSYQPWIGGEQPLFADYIVFGALQWARIATPYQLLEAADPVAEWFERCLDLHGGKGRSIAAAA